MPAGKLDGVEHAASAAVMRNAGSQPASAPAVANFEASPRNRRRDRLPWGKPGCVPLLPCVDRAMGLLQSLVWFAAHNKAAAKRYRCRKLEEEGRSGRRATSPVAPALMEGDR